MSNKTTPPLRGTPPREGNDSPSPKGWQAKPDGVVPKLRFPAFRDAGEWTNALLGKLLIGSPDYGVNAAAVPFADNLPKYLRITDISEGGQYLPDKQVSVDLDATAENYLDEGDIVLARTGASVGKSYRYRKEDGKLVFAGFLIRVKPDPRLLISTYLANFLTTDQFWKWIAVTSARSGQPGVNSTEYSSLAIPLPPKFSEQQKIADCLASLDERITLEAQKLDTLKTHKKGLMQQLFPAEGEALPKLRFPEFRDAGEWKQKLIEDFFDVGSSKRVLQQDWTTQGVPFYRTRELVSLSKNEPFGSEIFISEELFREISENYGLPAEGDFLVSGVGTLGISYQVQTQDRFYFKDGNVLWFKLKGGIVSTFFKYCFEADDIQNQILGQASISTVGTYTIQNAKVTKFSCPPNIDEQQKIADCLASLDDLITAQTKKLAALKTHKKGLMQQLFPSVGGVAGEA